ncbi:MAG: hypothetical protein HY799_05120 [Nitrosomonadales bacterium]|nr:hypothetical protein [Nitrosomonadales bacterium]
MTTFAIQGRCLAAPPPLDWREQLARMLGAKPRRIGNWAELGMYGALSCLADSGEGELPPDALLMLGSQRGTYVSTGQVLEQMRDDLPMPLTFLQTQPSQLLALLAAQMRWRGHAGFVAGGTPQALLQLASAQCGRAGMLLGWVDEMDGGSSLWLRLRPCEVSGDKPVVASAESMFSLDATHLYVVGSGAQAG